MMKFLNRSLKTIKNAFSRIKDKAIRMYKMKEKYRDLAPRDNISNGREYLRALHWAIKNKKIKNIALTGPYGAGKSSIINSYLKRHPLIKKRHLRISMATFVENSVDAEGNRKLIELKPDQIQEGILKQLFYKVNHRRIPQSRFRKLYKVRFVTIWGMLLFFVAIFSFFSFIFAPEHLYRTLDLITSAGAKFNIDKTYAFIIFGAVLLIVITMTAFVLRRLAFKLRINEIKVKDTTLTPENKDSESVFNKYMDEILYFFEETRYRIVFFEDLDRLKSAKIFVQLRELNTLLNNCETIRRPIVFVYAVKDDIFVEEDRTKFFEFIIPVIPVINSTNSGEIFIDLLKAKGEEFFKHEISQEYILDVSPYVSDMRVLQNIYNEFLLYKRTLRTAQGLQLTDKTMFSIIIFKNLYPKEFADLQMETGIIKKAFDEKNQYIENRKAILQNEIDDSVHLIEQVNMDALNGIKEVKVSMLCALSNWEGYVTKITDDWRRIVFTEKDILKDSFDMSKLIEENDRYIYYSGYNVSNKDRIRGFDDICRPYCDRVERLKSVEGDRIAKIQEDIEQKRLIISQISGWTLRKLIQEEDENAIFSAEVRNNKLLVFMLRNGYIDEKYASYVNYFKGSSITTEDMNYVLGVKDHEAKPFDYTLTKVDQVVNRLLPHEFGQKEALNFDILEYLLISPKSTEKLLALIKRLSDGTEHSWRFIDDYITRCTQKSRFIQLLAAGWNGMWSKIYHDPVLTYSRKIYYLKLLCTNVSIDVLLRQNGDDRLISKFFEEHDDILQELSNVETEKMVLIIPKLAVSFSKLKIEGIDAEILDCIFENCFYEINSEMIYNVVAHKDSSLCSDLRERNYTTICKLGYIPLIEYLHDELPFYIDNIILCGTNRYENINQIIDLVERSIADVELCKKIIQFEEFSLSNISLCCGDLYSEHKENVELIWNTLLNCGKIECSWQNVDMYWQYFGLTATLKEYIITHIDILCSKDGKCLDDDFKREVLQSDINSMTFSKLLKHLNWRNSDISIKEIFEANVKVMIEEHYLAFTKERYEELNQAYPELCEDFILQNQNDFLALMTEIVIAENLFERLLISEQAERNFKEKVIEYYGRDLMTKVAAGQIYNLRLRISKEIFYMSWDILDGDGKRAILFSNLDILQADDFEKCFVDMGKEYEDLSNRDRRHKALILANENHRKLVRRLEQVSYISSYEESGLLEVYDPVSKHVVKQAAISCRVRAENRKEKNN